MGCDIGGTFTDFVFVDSSGGVRVDKRLTTPHEPERAVIDGLAAVAHLEGAQMVHATTLVVNAVIERRGAATGLITTQGFRDVLELRRHMRTHVFDVLGNPAPPLIPRWFRYEVAERIFSDGEVIVPLDEQQVLDATGQLVREGIYSIAVVFLHSYANPRHELEARELIHKVAPEVDVSLSSEVYPLIGEFPRTSTTVVNAYTMPTVRSYMARLRAHTEERGFSSLSIMTSDGGLVAVQTAVDFPCRIIESGPVAGAIAALRVGNACGLYQFVSFDMGGTTAKACIISGGEMPFTNELEVARSERFRRGSGYPVGSPAADLIEIGAGGGSIAFVNNLGLVQIGPESAGAEPGPACYGRGGTRATITDANLLLGYLSADSFLGGRMWLDANAARAAIASDVADPLGVNVEEAAWRIHNVANEVMAAAIRRQMLERAGLADIGGLVAFGGAGPVHAYNLAATLGLPSVVIPVLAGVGSAVGLIQAAISFHVTRAIKREGNAVEGAFLSETFDTLEREATERVRMLSDAPIGLTRWADCRYRGQGFEIRVDFRDDRLEEITPTEFVAMFWRAYEARFGYFHDDVPTELVNLHLVASVRSPQAALSNPPHLANGAAEPRERLAWDARSAGFVAHAVWDRYSLKIGFNFEGPAIVEEGESTTIIGTGGLATVDASGALVIRTVAG